LWVQGKRALKAQLVPSMREFASVLERAMPDWKDRQEALRTQAWGLYWCHPEMKS
jgi:hypothetical protein